MYEVAVADRPYFAGGEEARYGQIGKLVTDASCVMMLRREQLRSPAIA